jgi:Protein of unknown function (DUF3684)
MKRCFKDFNHSEIQRLSSVAFIPVISSPAQKGTPSSNLSLRFLAPNKCYLGRHSSTSFHSQLFTFVDFGPRANNFLVSCGVRNEPTVDELAQILVADPRNFFDQAGGYDRYISSCVRHILPANTVSRFLVELRNIAVNYHGVTHATRNLMKRTPCLVASRRVAQTYTDKRRKKSDDTSDDEDESRWERDLLLPNKVCNTGVNPDVLSKEPWDRLPLLMTPQRSISSTQYSQLHRKIMCVPLIRACQGLFSRLLSQIEQLYSSLGSPRLSTLVREDYRPTDEIKDSRHAIHTRDLVLERLPLFLHERTHTKATVTYSWLKDSDHFQVTEVGKLTLTRTLQFGQLKIVKTQEASATAERKRMGAIRLWISGNNDLDIFE